MNEIIMKNYELEKASKKLPFVEGKVNYYYSDIQRLENIAMSWKGICFKQQRSAWLKLMLPLQSSLWS